MFFINHNWQRKVNFWINNNWEHSATILQHKYSFHLYYCSCSCFSFYFSQRLFDFPKIFQLGKLAVDSIMFYVAFYIAPFLLLILHSCYWMLSFFIFQYLLLYLYVIYILFTIDIIIRYQLPFLLNITSRLSLQ